MTNDTLKSLGYLKKSLKMSKKAISINVKVDPSVAQELDQIAIRIDQTINEIETLEAKTTPVQSPAPSGVAQPAPTNIVSTIQTISQSNDSDLLVDP